jgi:serpin B
MKRLIVLAICTAMVSACGSDAATTEARAEPGVPTPVSADELEALVEGNGDFAFRLYRAVAGDDNLVVSPHSIATALTMTYAGARGETAEEMRTALGLTLPDSTLHPARGELVRSLLAEPEPVAEDMGDPFQLEITNTLWAQQGYPFLDEFLQTLATDYGAGMNLVDFVEAAEEARQAINAAVEEQTRGRITELIPAGVLDQLTRLVLVNAIWFKGTWLEEFDPAFTRDARFTLLDGSEVDVPTMRRALETRYIEGAGYRLVELPYVGGASMVLVLPDDGTPADLDLDADRLESDLAGADTALVDLALPSFEFRTQLEVSSVLAEMGMETAFMPPPGDGTADFSGMTAEPELYVSAVLHEAFIGVDETGTEAAAATAVVMEGGAAPAEVMTVEVDRPFGFVIRHDATGEILFLGQVIDPRS